MVALSLWPLLALALSLAPSPASAIKFDLAAERYPQSSASQLLPFPSLARPETI